MCWMLMKIVKNGFFAKIGVRQNAQSLAVLMEQKYLIVELYILWKQSISSVVLIRAAEMFSFTISITKLRPHRSPKT
jgi:hypothetical protein